MAIKVRNRGLGPRITSDSKNPLLEADFYVEGLTENHTLDDVMVAVIAFAPVWVKFRVPLIVGDAVSTLWTRLYQTGVKDQKFESSSIASATVTYGLVTAAPAPSQGGPDPNNDGDGPSEDEQLGPEWRFSTTGSTQHITQAINTVTRKYHADTGISGDAPDVANAIGVSKDKVEGCDVIGRTLNWSYTLKGAIHHWGRRRFYRDLTGKVNATKFCGCEPGELLFNGVEANFTEGDGWTLTYNFTEVPNSNLDGIVYEQGGGGGNQSITKAGHDYLWFVYRDKLVGTAPNAITLQVPKAVYVQQVYEYADFTDLFKV